MPVISALGMQEDCKYEASLGYKMRLLSQKKKKNPKSKKTLSTKNSMSSKNIPQE
jgi:hypothetical protein